MKATASGNSAGVYLTPRGIRPADSVRGDLREAGPFVAFHPKFLCSSSTASIDDRRAQSGILMEASAIYRR